APSSQGDTPWFVKAWIGLGAWITTLFGIGSGIALLLLVDLFESGWSMIGLGAIALAGGWILVRQNSNMPAGTVANISSNGSTNVYRDQASLVLSLSGQAMASGGAMLATTSAVAAFPTSLAITALLVIRRQSPLLAFLSVLITCLASAIALIDVDLPYGIDVLLLTASVLGSWLLIRYRDQPTRFAAASALLLVVPLAATLLSGAGGQLNDLIVQGGRAEPFAGWPTKLVWMAIACWAMNHLRPALPTNQRFLAMAVAVSLMLLGPLSTASALGIIILAYLSVSRGLLIAGVVLAIAALGKFYYSLDQTLLVKSGLLALFGVIALIGWLALFARPMAEGKTRRVQSRPAMITALIGLALIGAVAGHGIMAREQVIATGKTVLLPLAPVDPRSLIQGDYMTLRLEPDILPPGDIEPRIGLIELDIDRDGVVIGRAKQASLGAISLDRPQDAVDRVTLRYHPQRGGFGRGGRVEYGIDSFFFQEGHATHYAQARFAVLKVAADGASVLTGLADENKQLIRPD
ncbi:MAG: GDYXXLXY domain-containing protein, partial [Pseudomonadota bacterium]